LLDLLRELRAAADERLEVRILDPNTDAAARLEAERRGIAPVGVFGVQGTATVRQDLYLGFVLRHRGREDVLPFVLPQHFESRFTAALRKLTREHQRVVGFLSGPGFTIARDGVALQHRVVEVGGLDEGEAVPADVEVLIAARPEGLRPRAAFALDQFVQRGGKLLLLLDRVRIDAGQLSATPIDSGLDAMLEAWGLTLGRGHLFELSDGASLSIEIADARGARRPIRYPYHLLVSTDRLAREHPVTSAQPGLSFYWTHPVVVGELPPGVTATTLATSTPRTYQVPALTSLAIDDAELNAQAVELLASGTAFEFPLAVALEGPLPSAFLEGAPAPYDAGLEALRAEQRRQARERGEEPPPVGPETTDEPVRSAEIAAQVVVIGDSDWATDGLLSSREELRMFLVNLVDWMALEPELMALRSRIPSDRRITDFLREERLDAGARPPPGDRGRARREPSPLAPHGRCSRRLALAPAPLLRGWARAEPGEVCRVRITAGNIALFLLFGGLVAVDIAVRPAPLQDLVVRPFLAGVVPADVARITVEDPAQGAAGRTALRRTSAAGDSVTWEVEQRFGFPAESFLIEDLLAGLARLTTADRAATEAASHARLGVGESGLRVRLSDSGGAALADIVLGVPPADPEIAAIVHVRRAGEASVQRAPGLGLPTADPAAWLRTRVLEFDPAEAAALELRWTAETGERRALALALTGGAWRRSDGADDTAVSTAPVHRLLDAAALLHLSDVVGEGDEAQAAAGLAQGSGALHLSVTRADGGVVTLRVGEALDAETVAATCSAWTRPWVSALPEDSYAK
jgi:hypothetical protein